MFSHTCFRSALLPSSFTVRMEGHHRLNSRIQLPTCHEEQTAFDSARYTSYKYHHTLHSTQRNIHSRLQHPTEDNTKAFTPTSRTAAASLELSNPTAPASHHSIKHSILAIYSVYWYSTKISKKKPRAFNPYLVSLDAYRRFSKTKDRHLQKRDPQTCPTSHTLLTVHITAVQRYKQ